MKKKTILLIIAITVIIAIIIFLTIFNKKEAKNLRIGNNSTSQEIVDYILNINSYKTTIEVEVTSNKNINKYKIKQEYRKPDESIQEVLEPSNIAGIKIIKNGNQLKMENSNLNLSSVFENYEYLSSNILDLSSFIKEYKESTQTKATEENNQIVMTSKNEDTEKKLYIDRTNGEPVKLEIKWTNKKNRVYILYNEVNINI